MYDRSRFVVAMLAAALAAGAGAWALTASLPGVDPLRLGGVAAWLLVTAASLMARAQVPLGAAGAITLARVVLVTLVGGLAAQPALGEAELWAVLALALPELLLDGLDGRVARARGEASPAGAAFDGETDAAFVAVLSLAAFRAGAGPAALAAGAMRYALLAAGAAWPRLRGEVPPSLRARVVCDLTIVALLAAVFPLTPGAARAPLGAAALAMLLWSFSFDVRWLLRR